VFLTPVIMRKKFAGRPYRARYANSINNRSSGFLVGGQRRVPDHDAGACRSERAHSFIAEKFSERPGAVKAVLGAAKRSLDGEDRSGTIPQEGTARWKFGLRLSLLPTINPEFPNKIALRV